MENNTYFRGMLWASGGNFIAMAAALITLMVGARLLNKEELGVFFLVNVVVLLASSLGDFGLRNTSIKFLSESEGHDKIVLSRYLWTINIIAALISGILLKLSLPLLFIIWPDPHFREVAWFVVPATTFQIVFQMGLSLFVGLRQFGSLSIYSAAVEIVRMLFTVFGLFAGMGVLAFLWGILLSRVLMVFIMVIKLGPHVGFVLSHRRGWEILRFGRWLQASSVIAAITFRMVDALLASFLGTAALAVYSTAMQIPSNLQRIFESIRPVLLGYISSLHISGNDQSKESVRILSGLLCLASLILILLSEPLVKFIYSSRYLESVQIMQLLSVWVVLGIVNYYLGITLIGTGEARKAFLLAIPQFFTMIGGCVLLVPNWEGLGAALSLIITSVVGNFIGCALVADGDRQRFVNLCVAFIRPVSPLLLLIPIILYLKPSFTVLACFMPLFFIFLFVSGGFTFKDFKKLYDKKMVRKATVV